MSKSLYEEMLTRSLTFVDKALDDINKINHTRTLLAEAIKEDKQILFSVHKTEAQECLEIYLCKECVLTVLNYHTFPVTAILDSVTLSQQGKLDAALDVRPFMFSGPAPTMVIWAGTNQESISSLGYPTLTDSDAEQAFTYWLRYIFGVSLQDDWKLTKCS